MTEIHKIQAFDSTVHISFNDVEVKLKPGPYILRKDYVTFLRELQRVVNSELEEHIPEY